MHWSLFNNNYFSWVHKFRSPPKIDPLIKLVPIIKPTGKSTVLSNNKSILLLFELFCIPIINKKNKQELNINTIVEIHTQEEAKKALYFKNSIIGINNRNLKTLETDLKTTYDLHKNLAKHDGPIICESGIKSEKEVEEIVKKTKINNFLIGESLLKNINENTSLLEKIVQISP